MKFSEMNQQQLYERMQYLIGEKRKKEQAGMLSEALVFEQKYYMAKSYSLRPEDYKPGEVYQVDGEEELFKVSYLNGVFAWGNLQHSGEERGFPIGRLQRVDQP